MISPHANQIVRRRQNGSATFVFIALLAIMVILAAANGRALFRLHREIKLLEQQQIKRLAVVPTNVTAVAESAAKLK